ncbi:MAG TPA: hypothetical protein VGO22_23865, partial [Pseudorhizobium sp.]|nr:hypothetical protein [Pseudorhizobium sp.]
RTTRLQLVAARLGVTKLEAGPKALAITLTHKPAAKVVAALMKMEGAAQRENRLVFEAASLAGEEPLCFFERVVSSAQQASRQR